MLAQHFDRIAEIDEMLVLREDVEGINRVIVPTSVFGEEIEDAHHAPGRAVECANKLLERILHSYYWPGMTKDMPRQLPTCPTWDKYQTRSKRHRAKANPIPTNVRRDILAIDVFGG